MLGAFVPFSVLYPLSRNAWDASAPALSVHGQAAVRIPSRALGFLVMASDAQYLAFRQFRISAAFGPRPDIVMDLDTWINMIHLKIVVSATLDARSSFKELHASGEYPSPLILTLLSRVCIRHNVSI